MKKRKLVLALMLSLMMLVTMIPSFSFADAVNNIGTAGGELSEGTYTLSNNVDLKDNNLTVPAGAKVTIDLNGHTLKGNGNGSVIVVNGELTLIDSKASSQKNLSSGTEGVVKNSNGSWTVTYAVYDKDDSHTYRTYTAGAVTGGNGTTGMAGGIHVNAGGSVVMNGGILTGNNTCDSDQYSLGGGVFLSDKGGTFTMNDGAISGNKAYSTVMQGSGAGVYVGQNSRFTMNGGVFSNNDSQGKTTSSAGAVYVQAKGTFTAKNSVFSGNTANLGGAFYATPSGSTSLENCVLINNEAKVLYGGAVAGGHITAVGSVISHNKAITNGGGAYIMNGAESSLTGCYIQNNAVSASENYDSKESSGGGGIATHDPSTTDTWNLTLNNCIIQNNSVTVPASSTPAIWGAGVKLEGPVVATITDTSIFNNTAKGQKVYGGGVSTGSSTQVTLNGKTAISSNKAEGSEMSSGGGIYMGSNGTVTMNAGSIEKNEAGQGGGVTIGTGSGKATVFNMNGGTISGNQAKGGLPSEEKYVVNTGGGVLITHWSYALCNLSGDAVIFGNIDSNGKASNLCLQEANPGVVARLTGALTSGAHIGINKVNGNVNTVIAEGTDSYTVTDADAEYFTYDDSSKGFGIQNVADANVPGKLILILKEDQELSYQEKQIEKHAGDPTFTNKLTQKTVKGAVTYTSSNEKVATVKDNGEVTIKGAGTAIITATAAETSSYKEASAEYTLRVTDHQPGDKWEHGVDGHWHVCQICQSKVDSANHNFEWVVDKEATTTEKGSKHEKCTVCGYEKDAVEIPVIENGTTGGDQNSGNAGNGTKADTANGSKTGDTMPIGMLAVLMLAAAAGIAFCGRKLYKSR